MIRESDIVFESGPYWVLKTKKGHEVYKNAASGTHSRKVGTYNVPNGLQRAKDRIAVLLDLAPKKNPNRRGAKMHTRTRKGKKMRVKRYARNPDMFHIATVAKGKVFFFDGYNFNTDRNKAKSFTSRDAAQQVALNLKWPEPIAVVNSTTFPQAIRNFLAKKYGKNPVGPLPSEVQAAAKRFRAFTGHEPKKGRKVSLKVPRAMLPIGTLDGVLYTTVRDGHTEKYQHKFSASSRPLLAASHDGKSLHILGGEYEFTERGIEDK